LSVSSVDTTGTQGLVTISPDHQFIVYDPNGKFAGLAPGHSATDTFKYTANDGHVDSNTATVTVTVTGVNIAPVLSGIEGTALPVNTGDAPAAITSSLTATDVDGITLAGATVSISSNHDVVNDTLGFTNQNGITGVFDPLSGTLTLTGTATLASYQ